MVRIGAMTLLSTNYTKGPNPNIYVYGTDSLEFSEATTISGGNIFFHGSNSLSFLGQTSILANLVSDTYIDYGL